ncbi:hypothetical protein E0F15_20420 [Frankia sp. B2]|uniref:hypothetical protein n=1 Tax=unclassified Frankia TaxID=2632575 RepID=UPI0006CA2E9E|nr:MULTISPECIES: hypothetical protein [unclassified Frankia]KPM56916.1 hypothetical protein ACG83_03540 [Frankia sp. R43]TFE25091.1 hypothetical protein E0F15_20420 [Frankia sp. B2]
MRLTAEHRARNEARIRAAIDRLLAGDIPPGGSCDIKTLARESGIDRTAFYGTRPYAHLRAEFETRLTALHDTGQTPDPRIAQITRLKQQTTVLQRRLDARDATITELAAFKTQALSRLTAQHDEITRLRAALDSAHGVRQLRPIHLTTT